MVERLYEGLKQRVIADAAFCAKSKQDMIKAGDLRLAIDMGKEELARLQIALITPTLCTAAVTAIEELGLELPPEDFLRTFAARRAIDRSAPVTQPTVVEEEIQDEFIAEQRFHAELLHRQTWIVLPRGEKVLIPYTQAMILSGTRMRREGHSVPQLMEIAGLKKKNQVWQRINKLNRRIEPFGYRLENRTTKRERFEEGKEARYVLVDLQAEEEKQNYRLSDSEVFLLARILQRAHPSTIRSFKAEVTREDRFQIDTMLRMRGDIQLDNEQTRRAKEGLNEKLLGYIKDKPGVRAQQGDDGFAKMLLTLISGMETGEDVRRLLASTVNEER